MTTIYLVGVILAFAWGIYDIRRLYVDISLLVAVPCVAVFAALWFVTAPLMLIGVLIRRFGIS